MKILITLLLMALAAVAKADSGVEPVDYTFIILSPHREYYAVQVLEKWDDRGAMKGRFEVRRSADGEQVWQTNSVLAVAGDLYLSDEPEYMVEIMTRLYACGYSGMGGGTVLQAPSEKQAEILKQTAVRFLWKGQVLASYSLSDLGVAPDGLQLSVSHVTFIEPVRVEIEGHWNYSPDNLATDTNPRFERATHTMSFVGLDGRQRVFNYTTGKALKVEAKAEAEARLKAARECIQEK